MSYNDRGYPYNTNHRRPNENHPRYANSALEPLYPLSPYALTDFGPNPFVVDINKAARQNNTYRTALWTGKHLQLTLMNIPAGEDIGLEVHTDHDQFLRIEEGQGMVYMGENNEYMSIQQPVYDDYAIFIPAGTWHNVINTGNGPLKLYSIYAPPEHPWGTVHGTKKDAQAAEVKGY